MLRTPAHRLDRRPHIPVFRQAIPPSGLERGTCDLSCFVNLTWCAGGAIVDDGRPGDVAVPADNGVRASLCMCLVRIERRVNTAEDNVGAARTRELPDFVAAQRIRGMDPDTDDIARRELRRVKRIQRFINEDRIAVS